MKIKLWNGATTNLNLTVLGGGFDLDAQRVQLIVRGGDDQTAGTIQMDPGEALRVANLLLTAPKPQRVEAEESAPSPLHATKGSP